MRRLAVLSAGLRKPSSTRMLADLLGDHGDSHAPEPAGAGRPDGERGVARR